MTLMSHCKAQQKKLLSWEIAMSTMQVEETIVNLNQSYHSMALCN